MPGSTSGGSRFARRLLTIAPWPVALAVVAGCSDSIRTDSAHPTAFVGHWVRLREDGTWGDTMEFRPDGSTRGSAGYPVPPSLRWEIKRDAKGVAQYCAAESVSGFCRNYRLSGDTLEMFGGPRGNTTFRRVR